MSAEERVRYDRQIRLWGLSAQQRLMQTNLIFYGITSAGSEVAKNMVLAGVKSVRVVDPNPVTCADLRNSFLLQPLADRSKELSAVDGTREQVACARLRELNPFVSVSCGGDDSEGVMAAAEGGVPNRVVLVQAASLADAQAACRRAGQAKLIVVSFPFGRALTLSVFLHRTDSLLDVFSRRDVLTNKPAAFQQIVLALRLQADHTKIGGDSDVSFVRRLQRATALVEQLGLFALEPEHIEAAITECEEHSREAPDAVSATVAGASVAQHVIQLIRDDFGEKELSFSWMVCDTSTMDVLVGDL